MTARGQGEAAKKLDAFGLDRVLELIEDGNGLTTTAKIVGVAKSSLRKWLADDPARAAAAAVAREATGQMWDEKAESGIKGASDVFELSKAKELAHHYRWRAARIAPKEYGDRQTVEHQGKVGLEALIAGAGADPAE